MPGNRRARREEERAAERAAIKIARAQHDPVAVANENQQLRNSVRGAHALVHVLVRRLAGLGAPVQVPREQWMALPPDEHLKMETSKSGDVTMTVTKDA